MIWQAIIWLMGAGVIAFGLLVYWFLGRTAAFVGCTRWVAFTGLLCYVAFIASFLWCLWWVPRVLGECVYITWRYL